MQLKYHPPPLPCVRAVPAAQAQSPATWLVAKQSALLYRARRSKQCTNAALVSNIGGFVLTAVKPQLFDALAKNDALLCKGQLHRLLTACCLHSGVGHLAVNCYSLSQLGPQVEMFFGPGRFAALYVTSGIAGNVASFYGGRSPLSVGASGAVFGLLGGYAVFLARNQRVLERRGLRGVDRLLGSLMQTCAINAALGFTPGSRIDNMGHLGGLLGGAACAYAFGPRLSERHGRLVDQPLLRPMATRSRQRSNPTRVLWPS